MKKIRVLTVLSFIPLLVSDAKVLPTTKEDRDRVVWERLVHAICMVESGCDDKAKNKVSSASGRFQMLKVYVDEVNRIKGKHLYSYKDRFDPVKSREMFEIYQSHHNPTKDIDKAIVLHRGKKVKSYIRKVKQEMCNL